MSPTTAAVPSTTAPAVLTGTPVVPGAVLGPVIRPAGAVQLPPENAAQVPEADRPAERARFVAAAETVAGRLTERAAAATGVSAEVLSTTAGLARDRGLLSSVEQRIDTGVPAGVATVQAAQQFMDMFTALGGRRAERVTAVRDIRDRIVADLTGQGEPGIPSPAVPSVLLADDLAPADTAGLPPPPGIRPAPRPRRRGGPGPRRGDRPRHTPRGHDQPHRDHRPPARTAVRRRGRRSGRCAGG